MEIKEILKEIILSQQVQSSKNKELLDKYQLEISQITPNLLFEIFSEIKNEQSESEILSYLERVILVFYHSLNNQKTQIPSDNQYLMEMVSENQWLKDQMNDLSSLLRNKDSLENRELMKQKLSQISSFDSHYVKKENLMFPILEQKNARFQGLTIMWQAHDEIRRTIKKLLALLKEPSSPIQDIQQEMANLFFSNLTMIYKEELILIPACLSSFDEKNWYFLHKSTVEFETQKEIKQELDFSSDVLQTPYGNLNMEEMFMMLTTLPLDMTYVDEHNKVRFFTHGQDRIFPRSTSVIGRDVKNCHPPQSVSIVEEIIESFRSKKHKSARFWIDLKGRKILIDYYALYNQNGDYKGVLEVSSDITEIQGLQGSSRLAQWK